MSTIPITDNALIIRTDFSDEAVWESLCAEAREPEEPFVFNLEFLDDSGHNGATVEQLIAALPAGYPYSFLMVADTTAMRQPDHPLLVVDLADEPGRTFRCVPSQLAAIENNLSIGNMGFDEFAKAVDEEGVFHGISGM
jgi:hypothetical protein